MYHSFSIFRQCICHFGSNKVARMSYIIAVGPKEALSSLIQSLLKALVHSNLPLRRSLIANDVLSFCSLKNFIKFGMICSTNRDSTNTGKNRESTYSEHYLYRYYCYLLDEVKNICTHKRQKGHFLNLAIKLRLKIYTHS